MSQVDRDLNGARGIMLKALYGSLGGPNGLERLTGNERDVALVAL